jgi:hypothetical protein
MTRVIVSKDRDPLTGCEVFAPAVRSHPRVKCATVADLLVSDVRHGERVRRAAGIRASEIAGVLCYKRGAAGGRHRAAPLTTSSAGRLDHG